MGQWLRLKEVAGIKFHEIEGRLKNSTVPTMNSSSVTMPNFVSMPDFVARPLVGTAIPCLSPLSREESSTESTPDESWSSPTALGESISDNMTFDWSMSNDMTFDASVSRDELPKFDISFFDEIMGLVDPEIPDA